MSENPRIAGGGSDSEDALLDSLGKEMDAKEASLSPFGGQLKGEVDFFPLAKGDKDAKKQRRYRGGTAADSDKPPQASEREQLREREHRKHKESSKRRPLSPPSGSHKTYSRRGRTSGRSSPHGYEGRRSQEHQGGGGSWDRERERGERDRNHPPTHGYQQSDREEGYHRRHGSSEHSRYQKDHHNEGRRGPRNPSPSPPISLPRSYRDERHQHRSRSPLRGEARRRVRDREEEYYNRGQGSAHSYHHHGNESMRRSELEAPQRQPPSGSSSGSEGEGGEVEVAGLGRFHPRLLKAARDSEFSSEGSGSDLESERERHARLARKRGKLSPSPDYSSSGSVDSEPIKNDNRSHSGSKSDSRSPPKDSGDKLSLPLVMRSKFDSDDEEDQSGGEEEVRAPPTLSRLLTGFQEGSSDEEKQHQQQQPSSEDREEGKKVETTQDERELRAKLMAELDSDLESDDDLTTPSQLVYLPGLMGCRNVESFEWLNRIEEGTYGVVHRARDKKTGEIVALKKLKMEKEREGFPITSLREINMLLKAKHPNIVHVKEIVVGSNMDKIFIVMEYVEHDLKALMETMTQPFLQGEVKTLMIQLLKAVHHLHDNWILHRDLKASNLLLSHKGILKVGDFGLAREYGSPLKNYTPVVVTLWYRPPELLLGAKEYSTAVDMWSVGCIFAEFLLKEPLFKGRSEIDQINQIFKELGTPNERIWPGYNKLPSIEKVTFTNHPYNNLRKRFPPSFLTENGFNLLNRFLTYDPKKRITAMEALGHKYFSEPPMPVPPSMFPTWPAKSEQGRAKRKEKSPKPPEGGVNTFLGEDEKPAAPFTLK